MQTFIVHLHHVAPFGSFQGSYPATSAPPRFTARMKLSISSSTYLFFISSGLFSFFIGPYRLFAKSRLLAIKQLHVTTWRKPLISLGSLLSGLDFPKLYLAWVTPSITAFIYLSPWNCHWTWARPDFSYTPTTWHVLTHPNPTWTTTYSVAMSYVITIGHFHMAV